MAGRRGGSTQRRVREAVCDSCSPDPHCRGLTRGSPSPTAPFHRRAPSSPGLRTHHRRSTVMPLSSPDPAEFSSSEDGDATAAAVSSSEDEDRSDFIPDVAGSRFSPLLVLTNSVKEDYVTAECLNSATSSASSTLSPTTAMLLCQVPIADAVLEEDRTNLVRSESVKPFSSPSLHGPSPVSAGMRRGGGAAKGKAEQAIYTVSPICSSLLEGVDIHDSVPLSMEEALVSAMGSDVVEINRAAPLQAVAGSGGSQSLINVGEALIPTVTADADQRIGSEMACSDFGGGSVSEEVRVTSVTREALRSQPTDGLRQPPSSPAVPESGVSQVVPVSSVDGV
ncbi:hypothetical protein Dimus_010646, partial [Dionaea muscipula]